MNVRVNLHNCKMKLLLVWGPRLCVEFGSVEHVQKYLNIFVFPRSEDQVSRCVSEQLEQNPCRGYDVLQAILFQDAREALEPCAVHVADYSRNTAQAL